MALAWTMSLSLSGKSSTFFSPLNQRVYWPSSWEFMTNWLVFYCTEMYCSSYEISNWKRERKSIFLLFGCVLLASIPIPIQLYFPLVLYVILRITCKNKLLLSKMSSKTTRWIASLTLEYIAMLEFKHYCG